MDTQVLQVNIGLLQSILGTAVFLFSLGVAWGTLRRTVGQIEKTLERDIKADIRDLRSRIAMIENRVTALWQSEYTQTSSPRQLNAKGKTILEQSGVNSVVNEYMDVIRSSVGEKNLSTRLDMEEEIKRVVCNLPHRLPDLLVSLKEAAYNTGVDVDTLLFLGALYACDLIIGQHGKNVSRVRPKKKSSRLLKSLDPATDLPVITYR